MGGSQIQGMKPIGQYVQEKPDVYSDISQTKFRLPN
jgi:hypothetical protein